MKSIRAIQFIKAMQGHGIKKEAAEEILSIMDEREGELATKADLEQVERRLEAGIKGNRWAIGLLATVIIGGLTFLGMYISSQISDTKADIREIRSLILSQQTSQATADQTEQARQ